MTQAQSDSFDGFTFYFFHFFFLFAESTNHFGWNWFPLTIADGQNFDHITVHDTDNKNEYPLVTIYYYFYPFFCPPHNCFSLYSFNVSRIIIETTMMTLDSSISYQSWNWFLYFFPSPFLRISFSSCFLQVEQYCIDK